MTAWQVDRGPDGSDYLAGLLQAGWEPFAVTKAPDEYGNSTLYVWVRRQVPNAA